MNREGPFIRKWIVTGMTCGLIGGISYPLLIFVPLPEPVMLPLAFAFGPLLSVSSVGLYHLIGLHRKTVSLQIATIANVTAGIVVNLMIIVQLAVRKAMQGYLEEAGDEAAADMLRWIWRGVDKVQQGLDVSWDVFLATGTFLFALNMMRHPRFGRLYGWPGVLIAAALLVLNLASFPTPPASAGSVDVGPLVGLWYLVVAIRALRSLGWVDRKIGE
jgi:hypothetical protein